MVAVAQRINQNQVKNERIVRESRLQLEQKKSWEHQEMFLHSYYLFKDVPNFPRGKGDLGKIIFKEFYSLLVKK